MELGVDGMNANTGRFGSQSLRNVFGFIFCFVWLAVCVPVFLLLLLLSSSLFDGAVGNG